jgi:lysophospholipase L1-like esterase
VSRARRIARRAFIGLPIVGLVAALAIAVRTARTYYDEVIAVHLDPTADERFRPENARLGPPAPGRPRVVLFGDSQIDFWRPGPAVDGAEIVNRGQHGDTSAQLLLRVDRDVVALQPGVVVLTVGTNDLKAIGVFPERARAIEDGLVANVKLLVEKLASKGVGVVLITPLPFGGVSLGRRFVWSDETYAASRRCNAALRALRGDRLRVVDSHALLADDSGRLAPKYARDDVHLNDAGYEALGRAVAPAIRELR